MMYFSIIVIVLHKNLECGSNFKTKIRNMLHLPFHPLMLREDPAKDKNVHLLINCDCQSMDRSTKVHTLPLNVNKICFKLLVFDYL